jgi:hypothetical protein
MRWLVVIGTALTLTPSATAGVPSPCSLLTNAQVAKALASKVASKQEMHYTDYRGRTCQWQGVNLAPSSSYAVHRELSLMVSTTTKTKFLRFANENQGAVRVAGVGEDAFLLPQGNGGLLSVYAGGYLLELTVSNVTSGSAIEKRLAENAIAQL